MTARATCSNASWKSNLVSFNSRPASLEKIFIENRIYRDIEECETWEEILTAIHDGEAASSTSCAR